MITDAFKIILSDSHNDTVWPAHWVWVTFIMKLYALQMTFYTTIMTSVSSQYHSVTFTLTFCYLWDLCALHSDCVTLTNTLCDCHNYVHVLRMTLYALIIRLYTFSVTLYDLPSDCVTFIMMNVPSKWLIVTFTTTLWQSQWLCVSSQCFVFFHNDYVATQWQFVVVIMTMYHSQWFFPTLTMTLWPSPRFCTVYPQSDFVWFSQLFCMPFTVIFVSS